MPGWFEDFGFIAALATLILAAALIWISVTDLRERRIPDFLSLPLIVTGLIIAVYFSGEDWLFHLLGAAAGYGLIWAILVLYRRFRGVDGIGLGDAKLLAAGGAWLGATALPYIILIASMAGLAAVVGMRLMNQKPKDGAIPFGPALAAAILIIWLFGTPLSPPPWR